MAPLELRIHRRHRAVLYASDPAFLYAVLADERGWRPLPLEPMTMLVFRHESLMDLMRAVHGAHPFGAACSRPNPSSCGFVSRESFTFIAQGKWGKAP